MERLIRFDERKLPNWAKHAYLLLVVIIGWTLFRAESFGKAAQYILNMFAQNNNGIFSDIALMIVREYWIVFLAGIVLSTPVLRGVSEKIESKLVGAVYAVFVPIAYMAAFVIGVSYLVKGSYNPFIYFNF
jgi:alginate O-acetyltransferase complex protein AlgI